MIDRILDELYIVGVIPQISEVYTPTGLQLLATFRFCRNEEWVRGAVMGTNRLEVVRKVKYIVDEESTPMPPYFDDPAFV